MALTSFLTPVIKGLLFLVLAYGLVLVFFAVFQRSFSYFPGNTVFVPAEWDLNELKPVDETTADGLHLKSWYCPPTTGNLTVAYFQGNASHFGVRNEKIRPWLDAGYGVLLAGYRGYNGNPGKPTEEGLYNDARAAIKAVMEKGVSESLLVFYGESLGTGVATQMAAEYKPAALILEAPFTSFPDVGATHYPWLPVRHMMRDRYYSLAKIDKVHAPLLLIHGEADNIVPAKLGKRFAAANG